ncbi:MAG: transposase [Paracoccaceae bacterium]|jgi:transposase
MAETFTITEFFKRFPTDEACLAHLMQVRFGDVLDCPKCGKEGRFTMLTKVKAFSCPWCGHHIHPMVGTPFERSSTPLQKWFYAMYLFTTTRHGVPAKELQRQLGVTYKTAWRIGHEIRKYMGQIDGDDDLWGHVEVDEAYIGGEAKGAGAKWRDHKTTVLGMVQRDGNIVTEIVPNASREVLVDRLIEYVRMGSTISSDEWRAYRNLRHTGYKHGTVNHSAKEYVRGEVHTNTIEGFWAMLKRSIRGTHIHLSQKHLDKYLGEFEYRFNMRHRPQTMFARLLMSF